MPAGGPSVAAYYLPDVKIGHAKHVFLKQDEAKTGCRVTQFQIWSKSLPFKGPPIPLKLGHYTHTHHL